MSAPCVDIYFTFGVQYGADARWNRVTHPHWPLADGDGYLRVRAVDWDTARAVAFAVTGGAFAFDSNTEPEAEYAPLGELAFINTLPGVTP